MCGRRSETSSAGPRRSKGSLVLTVRDGRLWIFSSRYHSVPSSSSGLCFETYSFLFFDILFFLFCFGRFHFERTVHWGLQHCHFPAQEVLRLWEMGGGSKRCPRSSPVTAFGVTTGNHSFWPPPLNAYCFAFRLAVFPPNLDGGLWEEEEVGE